MGRLALADAPGIHELDLAEVTGRELHYSVLEYMRHQQTLDSTRSNQIKVVHDERWTVTKGTALRNQTFVPPLLFWFELLFQFPSVQQSALIYLLRLPPQENSEGWRDIGKPHWRRLGV